VRAALLGIAAHGLEGELAPRLEVLITTYDDDLGLYVRTEAVRILAETSPARALEFLSPLVREDRPSATRPPQAALVEGWIHAARATGNADTGVLADVATNIFQAPEARYAAIDGLGALGGARAGAALEEILSESSSDGYVRRKAAQALVRCASAEELCAALDRLAGHESDPAFLDFLADMIDQHCAGIAPLADGAADGRAGEPGEHSGEHAHPLERDP
jgi:HEAT repeat protein